MDVYPPPAPVNETTSTYQKLLVPLRSKQTPDKDVVMSSPSPRIGSTTPTSNRPIFSSDDFIPFSLEDDTRSNKKRERAEEEIKPVVNPYLVRPVWVDSSVDVSMLSLGKELDLFYRWISLTEEENNLREHAIQLVRDIIKTIWHASRVEVFGSHYTKIALPSSDVDLMVYNTSGDEPLSRICREISEKYADEFVLIKLIPSAKMPILKLTTKLGEIKLDMCISVKNDPPNSVKIAQYLSNMPVLRPLVVTLKQFLQQFLLNDTYTGGAGSYLLTLMSISLLQFRANPRGSEFLGTGGNAVSHFGKSQDLGVILLEFFELYGRIFNYHKHGICVRDHGKYFVKQDRGWFLPHSPHLLSVEDPSDPDNDVGRGSFNMMQVRLVFFQAFVRLTHPDTERTMPNYKVSSLLTRVIDMDPIYLSRRQRAKTIGATLQKKLTQDDDKSENSEISEISELSDDNSYTPSQSVSSIMVGDRNLADLEAPTITKNGSAGSSFATPIEIDEKEVEVIDLNIDDDLPSEEPFTPLPLLPSIPSSRPIIAPSSSSSSSTSSALSSTTPSLSSSPTASKAYSNGISNVIVNNHSRSPNGHSHYNANPAANYNTSNYNPNYTSTTNFIPKQKNNNKVRSHPHVNHSTTSNTHHTTNTYTNTNTNTTNTTSTNTNTSSTSNTNTNTNTTNTVSNSTNTNNAKVNKKPNKKNKNKPNKKKVERPTGTHSNNKPNPNNNTAPAPSTSTSSTSSTSTSSSSSATTNTANATNAANAGSATNATNAGNAGNTANTTNSGNTSNNTSNRNNNNTSNNNNSAMFSPGKRRKF